MTVELGLILALLCAVTTQLSFLYKHRGANAAPAVDIRRPLASGRALFASKWFAIGMGVALFSFILHVVAMAFAPLSLVQAVLSTGIVIMAVMAEKLFGFEVGMRQRIGVLMTAVALVALVVTLPDPEGAHAAFSLSGMIAFEGGLLGLGSLLMVGPRIGAAGQHHGVMLGAAAGVLFGVSDIAIKAMTGFAAGGALGLVLSPWLWVCLLASVGAFYASARGMQDGEAVPVIAATSTAANVSAIGGGIIVFSDPLAGDALGIVVQALAFAMVIGAALLVPAPVNAAGRAAVAA